MRVAQEQEDEEAFTKISAIIQHKQQCAFWRNVNYVAGKKQTHSATTIQSESPEGANMEHSNQDTEEQTIFSEIHKKRYTLAGEAPIYNRELFQDFGYTANTPASQAILDGMYIPPLNSDTATRELFAEIVDIQSTVPANSVSFVITPEQWKKYWQVINEETSSSESGIHFGHYIVGCSPYIISHYHATCVTITLAHTIQLEKWS